MDAANAKFSSKTRKELEYLVLSIIKSGMVERSEDIVRFMRIRSSRAARKAFKQGVPFFFECDKCGCGKKIDGALLSRIHRVRMSEELRKFLCKDPEMGTRYVLCDLLSRGLLLTGRGWTIKIFPPQ